MNLLGLRTTIYKVSNLSDAKEWYSKILGIQPYFDQPFYVGFSVNGFELGLVPDEHNGQKSDSVSAYWGGRKHRGKLSGIVQFGATPLEAPQNVRDGIWVAMVKDPWANPFGIIVNTHFGNTPQ